MKLWKYLRRENLNSWGREMPISLWYGGQAVTSFIIGHQPRQTLCKQRRCTHRILISARRMFVRQFPENKSLWIPKHQYQKTKQVHRALLEEIWSTNQRTFEKTNSVTPFIIWNSKRYKNSNRGQKKHMLRIILF